MVPTHGVKGSCLATDPAAFAAPNIERLKHDLSKLVSIRSESPWEAPPSPGYREAEIAAWLLKQLDGLGLETDSIEIAPGRPNIWGRRRGTGGGPALMLCAHMDTVGVAGYEGDPFAPRVENGRLHGRGACDMKGAIASMLEAVRLIGEVPLRGDLLILFVADEEHGMTGSAHAGKHGPSADFAIVGEPTRLAVCPVHKGEYCGRIVVEGKAAHTSMPSRGRNAIVDMTAVIDAFLTYADELEQRQPHSLCGTAFSTISTIQGGSSVSSVPDRCQIEFDRRTLPGETLASISGEFEACFDRARKARPGLQVELASSSLYVPPLSTALDAPITQACREAVSSVTGEEAAIEAFPGCTDAPNLGISAVICGPGDLAQAHTIDEWVEIDQLAKAADIYRHAVIQLLR